MKHFCIVTFLIVFLPLILSVTASAQDTSCDHQIMDSMESRAWLGGQRRISQNANLILKPDSVLEYSCFDQFIGHLSASPDTRRFSEEVDYWGPISVADETTLDIALIQTVFLPLLEYLRPDSNYGHTFLGGRTEDAGGAPPSYGQYTCDAMGYVWELARCMNFMHEDLPIDAYDGFYDFPFYFTQDPRVFPPEFDVCTQPATLANALTEAHRTNARTHGDTHVIRDRAPLYALYTENPNDTAPYEEDPIIDDGTNIAHNILILPGDCGESAVVPTGVTVVRPDMGGATYMENVCSIPSCSFDQSACVGP